MYEVVINESIKEKSLAISSTGYLLHLKKDKDRLLVIYGMM